MNICVCSSRLQERQGLWCLPAAFQAHAGYNLQALHAATQPSMVTGYRQ
jgi:hypothetical protein